ncbi:MAG: peptide chain release factor H [Ruminococcus sp.]|nr:peptide chain release factor H [Ruminococcus sp.]
MIIQLSSGQGPAECELTVKKLYDSLKKEFPDIEMISSHEAKRTEGCTSILFQTGQDLSGLEGSVQWICRSPYRPNHKRKNWFVDISVIPEVETVLKDNSMLSGGEKEVYKENEIRFERFHCGGKGGQNVNKVETGVRLIHIPTGITVTSTSERSQYANKKDALSKLNVILRQMELEGKKKQTNSAWQEHTKIVRGNPVRVYVGMDFKRKV